MQSRLRNAGVVAAAFRSSKNALAPPIARPGHPTPPCCRRSVSSRFTYGTGRPIGSLGAGVFLADPFMLKPAPSMSEPFGR
jgi:hypothetical protein